jgi:hypothetical protein
MGAKIEQIELTHGAFVADVGEIMSVARDGQIFDVPQDVIGNDGLLVGE